MLLLPDCQDAAEKGWVSKAGKQGVVPTQAEEGGLSLTSEKPGCPGEDHPSPRPPHHLFWPSALSSKFIFWLTNRHFEAQL